MRETPEPQQNGAQIQNILYRIENLPEPQKPTQKVYPTSGGKFEKRGRR